MLLLLILLIIALAILCTAKCIHALMKKLIQELGEQEGQYLQMVKLEENVLILGEQRELKMKSEDFRKKLYRKMKVKSRSFYEIM